MNPELIKLGIEIIVMLASKHPEVLLEIITKVGPQLAVNIATILAHIEIKPPNPDTNLGG